MLFVGTVGAIIIGDWKCGGARLFISSGGKQGGNYLKWRSRKKNQACH